MNPNYNQNYTREEIDTVLAKIKSCVEKNRYTISPNENRISFHKKNKPIDYLFR